MKKRLTLLFFLLFSLGAMAQWTWLEEDKALYETIFLLDWPKAEKLMEDYPRGKSYFEPYLRHMRHFYHVFAFEDSEAYNDKKSAMKALSDELELYPEGPWKAYCLAEMYLQQTALAVKFQHHFSSATLAFRLKSHLSSAEEKYPNFGLLKMPLGLYEATVASVPKNYRWATKLVGFTGNIEKGLRLMKEGLEAAGAPNVNHMETAHRFVYYTSMLQLKPNTDFKWENVDMQSNPLMQFLYTKWLFEQRKPQKISAFLKSEIETTGPRLPYLYYVLGKAEVTLEKSSASEWLEKYMAKDRSGNFHKSAYRYMAWDAQLNGGNPKIFWAKVQTQGNKSAGADFEALLESDDPYPNYLLRARLLFDRGEDEACLALLQENSIPKKQVDKVRHYYRLGRVYQNLDETNKALNFYEKALEAEKQNSYEAARSALEAGKIYLDMHRPLNARVYFENCLKFSNYPFQEGLQQKAHAYLETLGG